jgi:hypothetical protein
MPKSTNPRTFAATYKHIGSHEYARKQSTKSQLKYAALS